MPRFDVIAYGRDFGVWDREAVFVGQSGDVRYGDYIRNFDGKVWRGSRDEANVRVQTLTHRVELFG